MMVFSKFHGSDYCFSTLPVRMWPSISHWGRCHGHDFTLIVATLKWSRKKMGKKKMVTMLCVFNSFPNSRDFFFLFWLTLEHYTFSTLFSPGIWREALWRLCQEIIRILLRAPLRMSLLSPFGVDGFTKCLLNLSRLEPLSLFILILCSRG